MITAKFFRRDPLTCARELIGAELVWGKCRGLVVETEAYCALADEAAHTFVRPSAREFVERHDAGTAYVYFSYGVHWMLNALVKGDTDGFVLFRALQPMAGTTLMKRRRGTDDLRKLCSGPGKLTQALNITGRHHTMNLCVDPGHGLERRAGAVDVVADPRIGITKAADRPWRFTLRDCPFISARART